MKLLLKSIGSELTQEFVLENTIGLSSPVFALWLYMHNSPTGTLRFKISGNGQEFIKDFDANDIKSQLNSTDNYAHLFFRISLNGISLKEGNYTLSIAPLTYVYSDTSYFGWCKDWENDFENDENPIFYNKPFSFRIFNLENREF